MLLAITTIAHSAGEPAGGAKGERLLKRIKTSLKRLKEKIDHVKRPGGVGELK